MGSGGASSSECKAPDPWLSPACSEHLTDSNSPSRKGSRSKGHRLQVRRMGCGERQVRKGQMSQWLGRRRKMLWGSSRCIWIEMLIMEPRDSLWGSLHPETAQGGVDMSHSLSVALPVRHPAIEFCRMSMNSRHSCWCHGKLRTVNPNLSSEFHPAEEKRGRLLCISFFFEEGH